MNFSHVHIYFYVMPLIVAISLVYSASRHESWPRIFGQAARIAGVMFTVLVVTTAVLLAVNSQI